MIAQARCLISDDFIKGVLRVGQVLREELPLLGPSLPICQNNAIYVSLRVQWPASDLSAVHCSCSKSFMYNVYSNQQEGDGPIDLRPKKEPRIIGLSFFMTSNT